MTENPNRVNNPPQIIIERINDHSIVAHIPGADLPFRTDEKGVAWVEAEALGVWVGYAHPADARKLAARLRKSGVLNDSEVFATVAETSRAGGRPARELWLTREGALKFAARSDTPRAIALLALIVDTFVAVMDAARRVREASRHPSNDNAKSIEEVRALRDELARLRAQVRSQAYPWGSEARVNLLRAMCSTLAGVWCRLDPNTTPAAERSRVQMKMRSAIGYAPGRGHTLQLLTTDEFERAVRWLHSELEDAARRLPTENTRQLALPARAKR